MNRKGFTLIELVMVIVIIGILAAVAIPKFYDLTTNAKNSAAKGALGGLRSAVAMAYANNAVTGTASFPVDAAALAAAMSDGVVPVNPVVAVSVSTAVSVIAGSPAAQSTPNFAWLYNKDNGRVWAANDSTW